MTSSNALRNFNTIIAKLTSIQEKIKSDIPYDGHYATQLQGDKYRCHHWRQWLWTFCVQPGKVAVALWRVKDSEYKKPLWVFLPKGGLVEEGVRRLFPEAPILEYRNYESVLKRCQDAGHEVCIAVAQGESYLEDQIISSWDGPPTKIVFIYETLPRLNMEDSVWVDRMVFVPPRQSKTCVPPEKFVNPSKFWLVCARAAEVIAEPNGNVPCDLDSVWENIRILHWGHLPVVKNLLLYHCSYSKTGSAFDRHRIREWMWRELQDSQKHYALLAVRIRNTWDMDAEDWVSQYLDELTKGGYRSATINIREASCT